jgi:hypothetical protein
MKFTAQEIQNAVDGVLSGKFATAYAAWKETGVSRQTIQARLDGGQAHQLAHGGQQSLTQEEEKLLVDWIILEDRAGQAPTYARIRSIAMDIRESTGRDRYLGLTWHTQFIGRHKEVRTCFARKVESARIKACNKTTIELFFKRYHDIMREFKVAPSNV